MANKPYNWPDGKTCAAAVTINLDAEYFARIFYPGMDVSEGDVARLGKTGLEVGLPRILDTLDSYGAKATFFVPGAVARDYPHAVAEIARRGHEIGCRGMAHEVLASLSAKQQLCVLREAKEYIEKVAGCAPTGFRMPEGEINDDTLRAASELGFVYSGSLADDDVPYMRQGLVELPVQWQLYDLPYFVFTFDPPIPPGQSRSATMDDVLENWLLELEGARRWGTLFTLQLDPQTAGEQGRIFMLERMLEKIQSSGDVWLATCREIAHHAKSAE